MVKCHGDKILNMVYYYTLKGKRRYGVCGFLGAYRNELCAPSPEVIESNVLLKSEGKENRLVSILKLQEPKQLEVLKKERHILV